MNNLHQLHVDPAFRSAEESLPRKKSCWPNASKDSLLPADDPHTRNTPGLPIRQTIAEGRLSDQWFLACRQDNWGFLPRKKGAGNHMKQHKEMKNVLEDVHKEVFIC